MGHRIKNKKNEKKKKSKSKQNDTPDYFSFLDYINKHNTKQYPDSVIKELEESLRLEKSENKKEKEKLTDYQISEMKRVNSLSNKKNCGVPESQKTDCSGKIIKAHTVSKKFLKSIAENGKLLGVPKLTATPNEPSYEYKELGIKQASIFTGFCSYHDREIFSEIENKEMIFSKKQCSLLAYRSIVMELYKKDLMSEIFSKDSILEYSKQPIEYSNNPIVQANILQKKYEGFMTMEGMNEGSELAKQDLTYLLDIFNKNIFNDGNDFDFLNNFVIKFKKIPNMMTGFSFTPDYDFNLNKIQNLSSKDRVKLVVINSVTTSEGGEIIFSWLKEDNDIISKFINSIKNVETDKLTNSIIQFFIKYSENTFLRKSWYNNLPEEKKDFIEKLKMSSIYYDVVFKIEDVELDDWGFDEFIEVK